MKRPKQLALRLVAGGSLASGARRSFSLPHPLSWTAFLYGALSWAGLIGLIWIVVAVL